MKTRLSVSLLFLIFSTIMIIFMSSIDAVNSVNVTSQNEEYGLFDAMKDQSKYNSTVDIETMDKANSFTNRVFGTLTSCIVYAIFALSAFTTACDLLYITLPPIRSFMYNPSGGQQQGMSQYRQTYNQMNLASGNNQQNTSSNSIFERIKNGEGALISIELRQLLNTPTSMVNAYMNRRPTVRNSYGRSRYNMGMNNYGQQNQMQIPEIKIVILEYFKNRVMALVIMSAVMVLLLSSSVFTDCGLNIGEAIMRWLGF